MSRPLVPYSMQVAIALLAKDTKKANMIAATAIGNAAQHAINIANMYEACDAPFVYVGLRSICDALYNTMDESARRSADEMMKSTVSVTVNADAIKKMYGKDQDKEQ